MDGDGGKEEFVNGLWLWMILWAMGAGNPLEQVTLRLPGRVVTAVAADVNGDGDADMLVFWKQGFPPTSRSMVSVFPCVSGRLTPSAQQVVALSKDTVAFDVADVRIDGKADVVVLTKDGLWVYPAGADGQLAQQPEPLIKAMTLAALPHEDHVPRSRMFFELDKTRRGLLVPTVPIGTMSLYEGQPGKDWALRQVLRVPMRANVHTQFEDVRDEWDFAASYRYAIPLWMNADQNGDGIGDLIFFSQDSTAVFRGRPDGGFPRTPDFYRSFGLITPEERLKPSLQARGQAADINGDKRLDLLFVKTVGGISNMKSELAVYLASADGSYPSTAHLRQARSGYGSSARLVDVNGDGRADLVRPGVDIGISAMAKILLSGKIDVVFDVFLAGEKGLGSRADYQFESPFGIDLRSAQELTGPYPILGEDFTGDGVADLVLGVAGGGSGDNPDRLEVHPGTRGGRFSDRVFWRLSLPATPNVYPYRRRSGERPGLIVHFPLVERLRGDVWVFQNF